jgi:hypothetical protein
MAGGRACAEAMTVVPIRTVGEPVLRRIAQPVTDFDAELAPPRR